MNLLFLSDVSLGNQTSGAEQVLINQAAGFVREGFEVLAITRENANSKSFFYREFNGVKEWVYAANPKYPFRFFFSILRRPKKIFENYVKNKSICAVICHQPFTCISLLLNRKLKELPLFYIFHSPSHEEYLLSEEHTTNLRKYLMAYLRKSVEGYCLKKSEKIIVLSQYMKQKAIKGHKLRNDLIIVNPGGVDLDIFKPDPDRERKKANYSNSLGKIHLLTVRNLEPRMGIDNLLRGVKILRESNVPVQLIIGGEGPEKERLQNLVKDLGIINDVILKGFIPADKLPQYYSFADFFIMPTRSLEGFGLVTIESLACGTPVLGTPVGGTKEILANFQPNLLFKDTSPESMAEGIRNAIYNIYEDKKKYDHLRLCCREYTVVNYSWHRHVAQLNSVIEELSFKNKLVN